MNKNILAENMKRFGTKNLHEQLQENFHKNADTEAYRVILDLLVSMSDTDEETVQTAVEAANNVDNPGIEHYKIITQNIIPMLQSIARDIDNNRYNYNSGTYN